MSSTTISAILKDAAAKNILQNNSRQSINWFMRQAQNAATDSSALIREFDQEQYRTTSQLTIGRMFMFFYDPKWKDTLPYYDRFPCIWLIENYGDRFLGLNLHYLPYVLRAKLMDALLELENSAKYPSNKKLMISYSILKSAAASDLFKPCIKMYLKSHVRSKLIKVYHREWKVAAFLPVHSFEKAKDSTIWANAR
jgi:hypothetical protein